MTCYCCVNWPTSIFWSLLTDLSLLRVWGEHQKYSKSLLRKTIMKNDQKYQNKTLTVELYLLLQLCLIIFLSFKEIFLLWNHTYLGGPVMTGQLPLGLKLRPIWSNRPRVWTHSCRDRQEFRTWKTFWKIRENHLLMNHHEFALAKGILFCKKSIHFLKLIY